jgi:DNA-binding NarL/FixJ family response regulator
VGELIGRDFELRTGRRILRDARKQSVARILRIVGMSGVGKTALAGHLAGEASASGWLCSLATAHRIQLQIPLAVVRSLTGAIVEALAGDAARYISGLESDLDLLNLARHPDEAAIESAFFRLVEGLLLDRPLLFVVDDMQWADAQSRSLLVRLVQTLADRPFVLSSIERSDEPTIEFPAGFAEEAILVSELDKASAAALTGALLPGAPEHIVATIADHTRGRPIDIVTIAASIQDPKSVTADEVRASVRSVVARDLAVLGGGVREFLQICSLLGEPLDYNILKNLWDEGDLLTYISQSSKRFLVQRGDRLEFVHTAIAQSTRETVPIEIPYRRRIIDAIARLPDIGVQEYLQLAQQSGACGDRQLERYYLEQLVEEASKTNALPIVVSSLERLLSLMPFTAAEALRVYARLAVIYNVTNSDSDTIRTCREGLSRASAAGISEGIGPIVAPLLFALWNSSDREDFLQTYNEYDERLRAPEDRALLLVLRLFAAISELDFPTIDKTLRTLGELGSVNPAVDARRSTFEGVAHALRGDYRGAQAVLSRSRHMAQQSAPSLVTMVDTAEVLISFNYFGPGSPNVAAALERLHDGDYHHACIASVEAIAQDRPQDVFEIIQEAIVRERGTHPRWVLLGIAGAAAVLAHLSLPLPLAAAARSEIDHVLRGNTNTALLPIASAMAYLIASEHGVEARALLRAASKIALAYPSPLQHFWIPSVIVCAAEIVNDRETLRAIAQGKLICDAQPWNVAHHELAALLAKTALHQTVESAASADLRDSFTRLGAPFFARLAGPDRKPAGRKAADKSPLSRRDREIATLVTEGLTNRDIAQRLVLSERTVEGHIANIFAKLNVGSRSQIVAWYLRSENARAFST